MQEEKIICNVSAAKLHPKYRTCKNTFIKSVAVSKHGKGFSVFITCAHRYFELITISSDSNNQGILLEYSAKKLDPDNPIRIYTHHSDIEVSIPYSKFRMFYQIEKETIELIFIPKAKNLKYKELM